MINEEESTVDGHQAEKDDRACIEKGFMFIPLGHNRKLSTETTDNTLCIPQIVIFISLTFTADTF